LDVPALTTVVQGTSDNKVVVKVHRTNGYTGPVFLRVTGLPEGLRADPITIADSADQGEIAIVADMPAQGNVDPTPTVVASRADGDALTTEAPLPLFVRGKPGTLDTTFATDGRLINLLGGTLAPINAFVSADDSILLPGTCTSEANATAGTCVARLTPDGALDPSYGNSGIATLDGFSPTDAVLFSDGSIVVGGSLNDTAAYGIIDENGKSSTITYFPATTALGTTAGNVVQTALAPNDSVVMLVQVTDNNGNAATGIAKANAKGFDPTFGSNGFVNGNLTGIYSDVTNATVSLSMGPHVAVRPNGKIVIMSAGLTGVDGGTPPLHTYVGFLQLESNGTHDTTFGTNGTGQTALDVGGDKRTILPMILPDGRILSKMEAMGDCWISAFKADGTDLDSTFGDSGSLSVPVNPYGWGCISLSVSVDDQNRLLATSVNLPSVESVWRYTDEGILDNSFGVDGQATTPSLAGVSFGWSFSARVQKDGRIVVLTWTDQNILVVSRLWN